MHPAFSLGIWASIKWQTFISIRVAGPQSQRPVSHEPYTPYSQWQGLPRQYCWADSHSITALPFCVGMSSGSHTPSSTRVILGRMWLAQRQAREAVRSVHRLTKS